MWEEDPRWQQGNYKFLLWCVGISGVLAVLASALTDDWSLARYYFIWLGVVLAALAIYAAIVWTVAHSIWLVVRLYRRLFHGDTRG
jgi:hypothetical protein